MFLLVLFLVRPATGNISKSAEDKLKKDQRGHLDVYPALAFWLPSCDPGPGRTAALETHVAQMTK